MEQLRKLKADLKYRFEIGVRISDCNIARHLGNDRVLTLCSEARAAFFMYNGYREDDIEGLGVIISDIMVRYMNEGFAGDQLEISIGTADIRKGSFGMFYRLHRKSDGREIARAYSKQALFDYSRGSLGRVSEKISEMLQQYSIESD